MTLNARSILNIAFVPRSSGFPHVDSLDDSRLKYPVTDRQSQQLAGQKVATASSSAPDVDNDDDDLVGAATPFVPTVTPIAHGMI